MKQVFTDKKDNRIMKQLTIIFTLLTALLLAASCSKEELPGGESTEEAGEMQTYTFSVSADLAIEGDAEPRSPGTQAELPTRCFMQALGDSDFTSVSVGYSNGNGSFTFFVRLPSNRTYTFMFWADNNNSTIPPESLTAMPYTQGTVAFVAKVTDTPENIISNGVSLKHVVTKVSLQHNEDNTFSPKKDDALKVTLPCATTYDVSNLTATASGTYEFTYTFTEESEITGGTDLCSLYVLAPSDANDVDISFRIHHLTISDIPMPADTHITLRGDFSSKNDKWEVSEASRAEAFQSCFFNEYGKPKGELSTGAYVFYSDQSTIERFFSDILDMAKGTYLQPFNLFGHTIICFDYGTYLDFWVDYTMFMISYGVCIRQLLLLLKLPHSSKTGRTLCLNSNRL